MGDGFIAADFADNTYQTIMQQAWAEFSTIQPIKQFKDQFNVYYVKAVSPQRLSISSIGVKGGAVGIGAITKFSSTLKNEETAINGNQELIHEYAKKAFTTNADERIKNATIVVMVNAAVHAGTCHNSWDPAITSDYGEANAVAFCALGKNDDDRKQLMYHEICGHGFGKLADEYYYVENNSIYSNEITDLLDLHQLGLYRNVNIYKDPDYDGFESALFNSWPTTTTSNVYWSDLIASGYDTKENLGAFKGAYTYPAWFCRPTENATKSIMNNNTGCFNAPSRRQILYRIESLLGTNAGSFGSSAELNNFLTWDAENFEYPTAAIPTRAIVEKEFEPLAPPVWHEGTWVNGRFIEGKAIK